jgi:hypothetical protein
MWSVVIGSQAVAIDHARREAHPLLTSPLFNGATSRRQPA